MTRDRGYPDWLVLSALLRLLWAGYISTKYICFGCVWLVAMCRYYSLLLCVVIFVTYLASYTQERGIMSFPGRISLNME